MRLLLVMICLGSIVSAACSFSFSVGNVPGKISGDPEFGEVVLATEVDATSKKPVTVVTEFRTDVGEMYAVINAKNTPAGSEFRFRWKKGGEQVASLTVGVPVDLIDNWVYGSLEPNEDVPPGNNYAVEVLYNGELVSTATFRVVAR